jgi:hypothetical protein
MTQVSSMKRAGINLVRIAFPARDGGRAGRFCSAGKRFFITDLLAMNEVQGLSIVP